MYLFCNNKQHSVRVIFLPFNGNHQKISKYVHVRIIDLYKVGTSAHFLQTESGCNYSYIVCATARHIVLKPLDQIKIRLKHCDQCLFLQSMLSASTFKYFFEFRIWIPNELVLFFKGIFLTYTELGTSIAIMVTIKTFIFWRTLTKVPGCRCNDWMI